MMQMPTLIYSATALPSHRPKQQIDIHPVYFAQKCESGKVYVHLIVYEPRLKAWVHADFICPPDDLNPIGPTNLVYQRAQARAEQFWRYGRDSRPSSEVKVVITPTAPLPNGKASPPPPPEAEPENSGDEYPRLVRVDVDDDRWEYDYDPFEKVDWMED